MLQIIEGERLKLWEHWWFAIVDLKSFCNLRIVFNNVHLPTIINHHYSDMYQLFTSYMPAVATAMHITAMALPTHAATN